MPPDAPRFHEKALDFCGTVGHEKPRKNGAFRKSMDFTGLQFGGGGGSLISYLSVYLCYIFLLEIHIIPPNMPPIDIAGAL